MSLGGLSVCRALGYLDMILSEFVPSTSLSDRGIGPRALGRSRTTNVRNGSSTAANFPKYFSTRTSAYRRFSAQLNPSYFIAMASRLFSVKIKLQDD